MEPILSFELLVKAIILNERHDRRADVQGPGLEKKQGSCEGARARTCGLVSCLRALWMYELTL